jgi:hypothetical protein
MAIGTRSYAYGVSKFCLDSRRVVYVVYGLYIPPYVASGDRTQRLPSYLRKKREFRVRNVFSNEKIGQWMTSRK